MHIEKHTGVLTIWVVSICWNRLLKALGAAERTRIYWAGGEPFGGKQKALEPIRKAFPELHNKDSLATAEELMPFKNKASSLAAIDYLVCLKSDVFLQSHGGNFGHLMHVCQLLIFLLIPTFLSIPILYLSIECMVPVGYGLLQANACEREEYGIDLFQVLQEQEQQSIKWVEILDSVNYWCGVCVYLCAYLFSFLSFVDILG